MGNSPRKLRSGRMAKNSSKTAGTSRIRFILFDAEIPDGEIHSVTQAISNALRGPSQVVKRITIGEPASNQSDLPDAEPTDAVEEADTEEAVQSDSKPKPQRRVAPKPSVIELDTASDPPLTSLVDGKSNHKRYLAIAAWLHNHRATEAITVDHIYTCYRHLGWPTNIADFAQPLRELKSKQYFTSPERGKYAINQLGLARATENSD